MCRLKPVEKAAEWLGKRGLVTGNWTQQKQEFLDQEVRLIVLEQTRNNLVQDERLFRVVCAAIHQIYGSLPRKGEKIDLTKEELSSPLRVYFCGLADERYTTGWLKSDANHKVSRLWKGDNSLGTSIREVILLCWDSFTNWFDSRQMINRWHEIEEIFREGIEVAKLWDISTQNFDETKKRVQQMDWKGKVELPRAMKTEMKSERRQERQQRMADESGDEIGRGREDIRSHTPRSLSNASSRSGHSFQAGTGRDQTPPVTKKPRYGSQERYRGDRGGRGGGQYQSFQPHQQIPMGGATGYTPYPPPWATGSQRPGSSRGFHQANPPRSGEGSYFNQPGYTQHTQLRFPQRQQQAPTQGLLPKPDQQHSQSGQTETQAQTQPWNNRPIPSRPDQRGYQGERGFQRTGKKELSRDNIQQVLKSKGNVEFQDQRETSDTRVQESIQSHKPEVESHSYQDTEVKTLEPRKHTYRGTQTPDKDWGDTGGEVLSKGRDLIPPGYTVGGQFQKWPVDSRTGTPDSDHGVPSPDSGSTGIRVKVNLEKMQIVESDSTSPLIGYKNTFDPCMPIIKIQRTDQWKQPMDREFRIRRFHKQNLEPIPKRKITKNVIEIDTWKGLRFQTEELRAERPVNFRNIAIPNHFSFRYEGLDEMFAELENEKLTEITLRIGYIGDSTMGKLRQWLICWQEAHQRTPAAIKFTDPTTDAQHLSSGIKLYDLTDRKLEDRFRKVDVVIIKTQVDFFEAWYYLEGTQFEGEAITHIICDFKHIIEQIREINNTASIIVVGMNPVNTKLPVPDNVKDDYMGLNFVLKTDSLLKDMVEDHYDCSFLSIYGITQNVDLCQKPCFDTLHMGPMVNMVVARDIYAQIHNIMIQRMRSGIPITVPAFMTTYRGLPIPKVEETLTEEQRVYAKSYSLLN